MYYRPLFAILLEQPQEPVPKPPKFYRQQLDLRNVTAGSGATGSRDNVFEGNTKKSFSKTLQENNYCSHPRQNLAIFPRQFSAGPKFYAEMGWQHARGTNHMQPQRAHVHACAAECYLGQTEYAFIPVLN